MSTVPDLYCDHVRGTDDLIDLLSNGGVSADWQEKLYLLVYPRLNAGASDSVKHYYRAIEVDHFRVFPALDGTKLVWTCPDCGEYHEDHFDNGNNTEEEN